MLIEQRQWTADTHWNNADASQLSQPAQLVLAFGAKKAIVQTDVFPQIQSWYPDADIVMCSTAGEILGTDVADDSIALSAIHFEKSKVESHEINISNAEESFKAGAELAHMLAPENLTHVLVFSDGTNVNGTDLVAGLIQSLPENVSITGGLVGDGADFKETVLGLNHTPEPGKIVAIGLYGEHLKVGFGSLGGWDPFGPSRTVTKSKGNILYELDHKPALELYKKYLGDKAKDLPSSGLLFPLKMEVDDETNVVRTLLAVNEEDQSMTFAGTIPEGVKTQLMKANFERLIDGAANAASMNVEDIPKGKAQLGILVSCVGRKLVLQERTLEEVEAVSETLGETVPLIGFYSYGEICPTAASDYQCQLHNQTMTITTLREE